MLGHLAGIYGASASLPVPQEGKRKICPGCCLSPVVEALGRLRQKIHHEFVASLGLVSEIQGSLG